MKNKLSERLISFLVCFAILLGCVPAFAFPTSAKGAGSYVNRVVDASTMDDYKQFFATAANGTFSTENAGGIWTDKSVFADNPFETSYGIKKAEESFLVALSAIASNMTVTGQASTPTDTIFVLDVSGSMYNAGVADDLAAAVNTSMQTLLKNPQNRVGIVLYSGSSGGNNSTAAVTLLPLGSYSTASDGRFVNYSNQTISLDRDVRDVNTNGRPATTSKQVTGATYIQKGIAAAATMFESATIAAGDNRKPVIVLLSDGDPTLATSNYTAPGQFEMGMGNNTNAAMGFVTQLTAADAKRRVTAKYGTECLFYTLGLGTSSNMVATNVLNPTLTETGTDSYSVAIRQFWNDFNLLAEGGTLQVQSAGSAYRDWIRFVWYDEYVVKPQEALALKYVNRYFDSADYSGDAAQALVQAFNEIVREIELQSAYHPTLISGSTHTSGYISFVDYIGDYMTVTDIKGMVLGSQYFSGAEMAHGVITGAYGTVTSPSDIGNDFVWSLEERLGVTVAQARTLIDLAYQNKQIYWNSDSDFSNYIGWYADADNNFLGFWHEGMEITDPNAKYIMRSYSYLGSVNHHSTSDMMYTSVRVRKDIATGEEAVIFLVPASLVPIITYDVTLDASGKISELTASNNVEPIRLIYEVALDSGINAFTANEMLDSAYISANSDNGVVKFLTNKYEAGVTGYGGQNTYSYFRPSLENDRYYYQEDSLIYTDPAGTTLYTGTTAPTGTVYHGHKYYENANGTLSEKTDIHAVAADTMGDIVAVGDGTWKIPAGTSRRQFANKPVNKAGATTGTQTFSAYPYAQTVGSDFIIGVTLGNNGLYTLSTETGIKLTKSLEAGTASTTKEFTFTVTNANASNVTLPAYKLNSDGTVDSAVTTVVFTGGVATVKLRAGETLYIGGMNAGDDVTVKEGTDLEYKVVSVNGDPTKTEANLTLTANTMAAAAFENATRGAGNLTVAKEVEHPFGTEYTVPAKDFNITVNLSIDGAPLANYSVTGDIAATTDANGNFNFTLQHNQSVEFTGLPEGTVATVIESLSVADAPNFTINYFDNGVAGDGIVNIENAHISSVIVRNDYTDTPKEVHPINIKVGGIKNYNNWKSTDKFDFRFLELTDPVNMTWTQIGTDVSATEANKSFDFGTALSTMSYTKAGVYYYRVIEVHPTTPIEGVSYDSTVHSFSVTVTDNDLDGKLEISAVTPTRPNTVVTGDNSTGYTVTANFTNVYSQEETDATVEIIKTVLDKDGNPHATASAAGFTFEVFEYDTATSTVGTKVADIPATSLSGIARLDLHYTRAADLNKTYTYAIKEVNAGKFGWTYDDVLHIITVEISDVSGYLVAKAYIGTPNAANAASATSSVAITVENTYDYNPAPAELDIDFVKKVLAGRALAANEFNFKLTGTGSTVDSAYSVELTGTNDATGKVTFNKKLTFDKVGIYFHDITEVIPTTPAYGITYDTNIYRLTVEVTDDGNGQLHATPTLVNVGGTSLEITFNNTFVDNPEPARISIPANKTLTGLPLINDEFTFVMKEANANKSAVVGGKSYTAKNLTDGTVKFPEITYNAVGTYYYLVSETAGTRAGIVYDTKEYFVTVEVTRTGNALFANATYELAGSSVTAIEFENKYVPAPTSVQLKGTKFYHGAALTDGLFNFVLRESDSAWSANGKILETVSNVGNGFTFKALDYNTTGTYYYLISEENGGQTISGITYDSKVYRVTVVISDRQLGALEYSVSYTDGANIPEAEVIFNNSYTVAGETTVTLGGDKILNGRPLEDGEFSFELYETDSSYDITGINPITAVNAGGKYAFNLTFGVGDIGDNYVVIKEVGAGAVVDGVTYSDVVYKLKITVSDGGSGSVVAAVEVEGNPTLQADELDFTNTYAVSGQDDITFSGEKILTGRPLNDGEFTFELYKTDNTYSITGLTPTTATNAAGRYSFNLAYTPSDIGQTYYYLIKEANAGTTVNGVTYSSVTYKIEVAVTDDGRGNIVATPTVVGQSALTTDKLDFTNTYVVNGQANVILSGEKILTGRPLNDGEFTFELYKTDTTYSTAGLNPTLATNNAGRYSFNLAYTPSDIGQTYYYLIKEANAGTTVNGVTYSSVTYKIEVAVTDDGRGNIVATPTVVGQSALTTDELDFTNTFTVVDVNKSIVGTKILNGKSLSANEFTFELYDNGTLIQSTKNFADGSFVFIPLSFSKAGVYTYTVKESSANAIPGIIYDSSIYTVTITVSNKGQSGLDISDTKIEKDGASASSIVFTNTYDAKDATANIGGTKVLNGRELKADEFTFELYENGTLVSSAKNLANGAFTFATLTFDSVGTYTYTVRESSANAVAGVIYDTSVYTVTITVTDNGQGELVVSDTSIAKDGASASSIVFTNTYDAKDATANIGGTKVLNGRELKADEFTFELYENGTLVSSAKNLANGAFTFATLTFDSVGTYTYTVKESSAGQVPGVVYDDSVYTVVIKVVDNGQGELTVSETKFEKNGASADAIAFTNSYDAEDASLSIGGTKILDGRNLAAGEFTFHLYKADAQFKYDSSSYSTAVNSANGSFAFNALAFDASGTYYYVVAEDASKNIDRVTYDDAKYLVTITVKDDTSSGKLVAEYAITKAGNKVNEIVFTNVYTPKPNDISVSVSVNKKVENVGGEGITPEGFNFILKNKETGETLTAVSDSEGLAKFALGFSEGDIGKTYTYSLTEVNDGRENVTYSTAEYTISVKVTLSEDNKLLATVSVDGTVTENATVEFVNHYTTSAVKTGDEFPFAVATLFIGSGALCKMLLAKRKKLAEDEE